VKQIGPYSKELGRDVPSGFVAIGPPGGPVKEGRSWKLGDPEGPCSALWRFADGVGCRASLRQGKPANPTPSRLSMSGREERDGHQGRHHGSPPVPLLVGMRAMAPLIEDMTRGRYKFEYYPRLTTGRRSGT